ncbi:MAG: hypothetical protein V7701_12590 [Sneathiella sp.]
MNLKVARCLVLGISVSTIVASSAIADNRGSDWQVTGCEGVVENELASLKLGTLEVDKVRYIVQSSGSFDSDASESLDGWVSFKSCKGNLVVKLSQTCQVDSLYTTGECKIEGVSDY